MLERALRIKKKSQRGSLTTLASRRTTRYPRGDLGETNYWKMGGGSKKMVINTHTPGLNE